MSEGYAMLYDSSRCSACRACQAVCKNWHNLPSPLNQDELPFTGSYQSPADVNKDTRLIMTFNEQEGGIKGVEWAFGRRSCYHCGNAPCEKVCPSGCLFIDEETHFVGIDPDKCVGCHYCSLACPYDIPQFYGNTLGGKINKCDMCLDRLDQGLIPACVKVCEPQALKFGTREEMLQIAQERLEVLKERGLDKAVIYGENLVGGLHTISILKYGIEQHDMIAEPKVSAFVPLTKVAKPITGVAAGAVVVGLGAAFISAMGYKPKELVYNELTEDTINTRTGTVIKHGDGQDVQTAKEELQQAMAKNKEGGKEDE